MGKLERIRPIAAHRLPPNASLEQLLDFMADYVLQREDPAARHERRKLRKTTEGNRRPVSESPNTRHVPAEVRDQVFVRDQGQCTYAASAGKRCTSEYMLQLDHVVPVARGGASTVDNLRLLGAYHNRLEAERIMGTGLPSLVREVGPVYLH